jgi:CRP/FNR family cyclic AMP-dependent transcriptional regulator
MRNNAALAFDPKAFLTRIEDGKTTREYRSDQIVFSQGDAADAVFYVQSGKVKLTVVSTRGKEAVIGVLERGSFFGEGCLAAQPLRMSTASVIQPSSIIRVGRSTMVRVLHKEPEFAELFTAYLLS